MAERLGEWVAAVRRPYLPFAESRLRRRAAWFRLCGDATPNLAARL